MCSSAQKLSHKLSFVRRPIVNTILTNMCFGLGSYLIMGISKSKYSKIGLKHIVSRDCYFIVITENI